MQIPREITKLINGYVTYLNTIDNHNEVVEEFKCRLRHSPLAEYDNDFLNHVNSKGNYVQCNHPYFGFPIETQHMVFLLLNDWQATLDVMDQYYEYYTRSYN